MPKELRIVMGETNHETFVYLDSTPIGMIQSISIHASVDDVLPRVEIVFPNLFAWDIDSSYFPHSSLPKELAQQIWDLSELPNVKIILKSIW